MNSLYMGIDCGGSKISCLVIDSAGRLIAETKRSSDGLLLKEASSLKVYEETVREVLETVNGKCRAVFCNTGGFPPDGLDSLLCRVTETANIKIARESSGELIVVNAPLWNFDIAIMAGTGSVAVGVADNAIVSVGGWGCVIDDRGSGFSLGRDALRVATGYADGKYKFSPYIADILTALAIHESASRNEVRTVLKTRLPEFDRQRVASLAPLVTAYAEQEDPFALNSVENAADELAELALLIAGRLKLQEARVAAIGGLFSPGDFFRICFRRKISKFNMQVCFDDFNLLKGAALCALVASGVNITEQIMKNLKDI